MVRIPFIDSFSIVLFCFKSETRTSTLKGAKRKMAVKQVSSDADVNDTPSESEEYHSDSSQSNHKIPLSNTRLVMRNKLTRETSD